MKSSMKNFNLGASIIKRKKNDVYFFHIFLTIFCAILFFLIIFYFYCSHKRNILLKKYKVIEKTKKELETTKNNLKNLENLYENLVNKNLNSNNKIGLLDIYDNFEYISKIIPDNIRLNNFKYDSGEFTITGLAKTNKDLSNFLNLLKQNKFFKNISLTASRNKTGNNNVINFCIKT